MSKRFVLVVSDKGGTGKSTWARGYADWLRRGTSTAYLADADGTVGQLLQFYGTRDADGALDQKQDGLSGVAYFSIQNERERDCAFDALDSGADRVLIDLPAGAILPLSEFNNAVGLFDHARRQGYAVTIVNVITPMLASGRTVGLVLDRFEKIDGVSFVVVKNRLFGPEDDDFERYDGSKGRGRLKERGGVEIDLPAMRMRTYSLVDEMNLRFSDATKDSRLKTVDRSVVHRWLERFDAEVQKAAAVL
ncbi:hypothetical protein [Azospirillum sp. sgz302134]